eukprot:COSAG01_NODE_317_length_18969_cov_378.101219_12_plen_103_part_00
MSGRQTRQQREEEEEEEAARLGGPVSRADFEVLETAAFENAAAAAAAIAAGEQAQEAAAAARESAEEQVDASAHLVDASHLPGRRATCTWPTQRTGRSPKST